MAEPPPAAAREAAAREALAMLAEAPREVHHFSLSIVSGLVIGGLVTMVDLPVRLKRRVKFVRHLQITEAGKAALGDARLHQTPGDRDG